MIKIIIPAAGNGQRFIDAGYKEPKPLIKVLDRTMVEQVIRNLTPSNVPSEVIFIHKLETKPEIDGVTQVKLNSLTGGAVDTILRAKDYLAKKDSIILANCDQLAAINISNWLSLAEDCDGSLVTFKSNKPHHSYVKLDHDDYINEIVEKEVISNNAVTGIYYFKEADQFIQAAERVIARDIKTKGEYYVSSAIKLMIEDGLKFNIYEAPSAMLGTPEELQLFLAAVQVGKGL